MLGGVRRQPAHRLRKLPLAADPVAAACLVPGDRNVHEPLEKVAFLRGRRPPGVLELLVRGEVVAGTDQLEAAFEAHERILAVAVAGVEW